MAADAPNAATPHPGQAPARERKSVQRLLRGGLLLACLCMAAGFLAQLARGELAERPFHAGALFSPGLTPGERLMGGGILLLALTPAVRVIALLVLWSQERDWKFALVALAVIATLCAAIALGGG